MRLYYVPNSGYKDLLYLTSGESDEADHCTGIIGKERRRPYGGDELLPSCRSHHALRQLIELLHQGDELGFFSVDVYAVWSDVLLRVEDIGNSPCKSPINLGMIWDNSGNGDVSPS